MSSFFVWTVVRFDLWRCRFDGVGEFKIILQVKYLINSAFPQACTTPTCICTSANEASVQACVTCAVGADPSESVITSAQDLIECVYLFLPSIFSFPFLLRIIHAFSLLAFEAVCSSVPGIPSVTINTNAGTGTPNTATLPGSNAPSTSVVPTTTVPQIVIGPSSTTSAPTTASSVGSTSTTSITGFPLKSSASPNKIILHWTVALLGLVAARNLLVFWELGTRTRVHISLFFKFRILSSGLRFLYQITF